MKISVIIENLKQAKDVMPYVDTYLLPIDDFSINYPNTFSLDDVNNIKKLGREIFVIVNKNIHNSELEHLKKLLLDIDKINVNGIIYYDLAILNLKNKLNINTDLVWNQEHLTNNYGTINYYFDKGVKYTYLSSELNKNEIEDITKKSKAKLFLNVFGHIPMFTSRRHLVKNYLDYFDLEDKQKNKTINKEGKTYPILDTKNGTIVYSNYILNILDHKFNVDYYVFNSYLIKPNDFKEVLINFKNNKETKFPFEYGFLYKETIYKVKRK